ncbi:MAG: DUF1415 domain-containing protein [Gammaproteobacteria bacterium]|nr:DUF1415 domain-containing protein [Gammaproteobacteria bacterium]MDH5727843.1 DUF1415 domain-containing protein [Gammaproteobacteria bacterium]
MNNLIIEQTRRWIENVVIGENFCPFAQAEWARQRVRLLVQNASDPDQVLSALQNEFHHLDNNSSIETSLLILTPGLESFLNFLDCLDQAQALLEQLNFMGIFQLASFHPDYCFEGADENDAANYTNRSPYPMFHIIRESSLSEVLKSFLQPENIPQRNIEHARRLGLAHMQALLNSCMKE